VSCFADGPSFLEVLSNGIEVQIALLDSVLPEMSGFELLGALRERGVGLPVVFLTGYSLVERELQALDRGGHRLCRQGPGDWLTACARSSRGSARSLPQGTRG
jgi:FixJ family two-component response regulator